MRDTSQWKPLDPKVKALWQVSGLLSGLLVGMIVLIFEFFVLRNIPYPVPIGITSAGAALLVALPAVVLAGLQYKNARYFVGDDDLAYSRGILFKSQRFINRARIQHVDITQGPIARWLGLVEVSVFVGGQLAAAISIHGLTREEGEHLQSVLLEGSMVKYRAAVEAPPPVSPSAGEPAPQAFGAGPAIAPPPAPLAQDGLPAEPQPLEVQPAPPPPPSQQP